MLVIAKGVETAVQKTFLLNNGCSLYQGFLFSRPVHAEQISAVLATYPPVAPK